MRPEIPLWCLLLVAAVMLCCRLRMEAACLAGAFFLLLAFRLFT